MKKIVVASDSFKGSITSLEIADSVAIAVHRVFHDCEVKKIPIADGGEGTVDALVFAMGGRKISCYVHDPLMRPIKSTYGILGDNQTAVIEMALASGLTLLSPSERNPLLTTTYGTGELIRDALARGCRKFLIGIGGSATNDAGVGMLQALGFRFLDKNGKELRQGGAMLRQICFVDKSGIAAELKEASFEVACDVDNPLYGEMGAAYVFARQKGADNEMIHLLDDGLRNFANIVAKEEQIDINNIPGAGAAGGLGGGLIAFLKAKRKLGIQMVLDALRFEELIKGADLIITGEGKLDWQTCMGKAPYGVLCAGVKSQIPVIAIAGSVEATEYLNQHGFLAVLSLLPYPISLEQAMDKNFTRENIVRTIEQMLRIVRYRL